MVSGDQDGAGDEEDGRGDQQQHVADVQEPEEGGWCSATSNGKSESERLNVEY